MARHELTDEQWKKLKELLPGKKSDPGCTARNNRRFVDRAAQLLHLLVRRVFKAGYGPVPGGDEDDDGDRVDNMVNAHEIIKELGNLWSEMIGSHMLHLKRHVQFSRMEFHAEARKKCNQIV